jgi:hypothetical protein
MKLTKLFLLAAFPCFIFFNVSAQETEKTENTEVANRNIVKLNFPGLFINNYSLQYERILTRKSSVALSFRFMPEGKIPLQSRFKEMLADEDPELQKTVDRLRISNIAITPEYRLYLGKGHGRGFYIAPFYRYAKFKSNNIIITYDGDILGTQEEVNLSGDLSSHTFGVLFGAQWKLTKNISLDWQIVGPHYGSGNGNFVGLSTRPLSTSDQQRVREELENLDIPFTKKTITTSSQGATMKLDGPWGGVRSGLSLGISF